MNLSELKALLPGLHNVQFQLENGTIIPEHFHITEVGLVDKHFIDCGGTARREQSVSLQLWNADDYEHRLQPSKLLNIIQTSEEKIGMGDMPVEVEYQSDTIGKYDLDFNGRHFILVSKKTACLAGDQCGTPAKQKVNIADLWSDSCTPGSNCCQ